MIRAITIISTLIFFATSVLAQEDQTPSPQPVPPTMELMKPVQCYPTSLLEQNLMEKYLEVPFIKFVDGRFNTIISITINPDKGTLTIYESHQADPDLSCVLAEGVQARILTTVLEFIMKSLNKGIPT